MVRLRHGVSTAEVDYGTVLLDEARGQYWNLNPTGVLVLEVLLNGGTTEDAASALAEEYAIDLETARRDIDDLVGALTSSGLVEE